jgi:hypothetical protein
MVSHYADRLTLLPNELFTTIVNRLELKDLQSLRLVARSIDVKVVNCTFILSHLRVELDESQIQQLCDTTSNLIRSAAIKTLTFTAHVYDLSRTLETLSLPRRRPEEVYGSIGLIVGRVNMWEKDIETMEQNCLQRTTQNMQLGSDATIGSLSSVLSMTNNLRAINLRTSSHYNKYYDKAEVYETAMLSAGTLPWLVGVTLLHALFEAISRAELKSLRELTICGVFPKCSMSLPALVRILPLIQESSNLRNILSRIESFTLGVNSYVDEEMNATEDHLWHDSIDNWSHGWSSSLQINPVASLTMLLSLMPALHELDLHFYTPKAQHATTKLLQSHILEELTFEALEKCTFRGFMCSNESLARFIGAHSCLQQLALKCIKLSNGSWQPILNQISCMPQVQSVRLESLQQMNGTMLNLTRVDEGVVAPQRRECLFYAWEYICYEHGMYTRNKRTFEDPKRVFHFKEPPAGKLANNGMGQRWKKILVRLYGEAWQ